MSKVCTDIYRASEKAQWVKSLDADQCKTDDLSWILETHAEVEGENCLHTVDL